VRFVAEYADRRTVDGLRWGVEPICRVLTERETPIAPSTFYDARGHSSARRQRGEQLKAEITRLHRASFGVHGARKSGWRSTAKARRWPAAPSSGSCAHSA
jgi:putative transposase